MSILLEKLETIFKWHWSFFDPVEEGGFSVVS